MTLKRRTPLKRTPMKPAKSTLRRSGRIKSKPVSQRKGRDVQVIAEYMAEHPWCEFQKSGAYDPPGGHWQNNYEPHHAGRIKIDDKRILLSLCTNCHATLHDESDPSFVVLCLWQKMQDKLLDRECLELYSRHFRGGNIIEYIRRDHDWIEEGLISMRDSVVAHAQMVGYWEE